MIEFNEEQKAFLESNEIDPQGIIDKTLKEVPECSQEILDLCFYNFRTGFSQGYRAGLHEGLICG